MSKKNGKARGLACRQQLAVDGPSTPILVHVLIIYSLIFNLDCRMLSDILEVFNDGHVMPLILPDLSRRSTPIVASASAVSRVVIRF